MDPLGEVLGLGVGRGGPAVGVEKEELAHLHVMGHGRGWPW